MSGSVILRYRVVLVVLVHAVLVGAAWFLAWWLRLDDQFLSPAVPGGFDYGARALSLAVWVVLARLACLAYFGLFQGLWRYVSVTDLVNLGKATAAGSVLYCALLAVQRFENVPRSVVILEPILCIVLLGGIRFAIRSWREAFAPALPGGRRVIVAGAGDAGEMLLREMRAHRHLGYEPVGFVDDDMAKWGTKIHGVPVLGGIDDLQDIARTAGAEEVIVAAPSAGGEVFRRVLDRTAGTGIRLRRLPTTASDIVRLTGVRDVAFEDLLDREPVEIDLDGLRNALRGQVVLVTGAGGSIGSEIVRQLAPLDPGLVLALDRSENSLFFLEREMSVHHPDARVRMCVGDVNDRQALRALFAEAKPRFVLHAAAYKHVPLMESHPVEAVQNNVAATLFLAELSVASGVSRFLLISSDKAVNPTSVMGATKRAAELALQSLPPSGTTFVAVRFGNVLGSEGSVVPLFRRQIQEGGPVTVTHPDVVRYFMTIREAVGLVLQAGVVGPGAPAAPVSSPNAAPGAAAAAVDGSSGTIFHLDMGRPVRVADLAEKLILLSGFRPHDDIEIRYTGLRPGEKLSEELLAAGEGVQPTSHPRILGVRLAPADRAGVRARVDDLLVAAAHGRRALVRALRALVPEYEPQNDEFRRILAEDAPPEPARSPGA